MSTSHNNISDLDDMLRRAEERAKARGYVDEDGGFIPDQNPAPAGDVGHGPQSLASASQHRAVTNGPDGPVPLAGATENAGLGIRQGGATGRLGSSHPGIPFLLNDGAQPTVELMALCSNTLAKSLVYVGVVGGDSAKEQEARIWVALKLIKEWAMRNDVMHELASAELNLIGPHKAE
jgi:hypothetical protein